MGVAVEQEISEEYLNMIKARLGSIAPSVYNNLPNSVKRLLGEDLTRLIKLAESTIEA
jgi:spore coat protein CotF